MKTLATMLRRIADWLSPPPPLWVDWFIVQRDESGNVLLEINPELRGGGVYLNMRPYMAFCVSKDLSNLVWDIAPMEIFRHTQGQLPNPGRRDSAELAGLQLPREKES